MQHLLELPQAHQPAAQQRPARRHDCHPTIAIVQLVWTRPSARSHPNSRHTRTHHKTTNSDWQQHSSRHVCCGLRLRVRCSLTAMLQTVQVATDDRPKLRAQSLQSQTLAAPTTTTTLCWGVLAALGGPTHSAQLLPNAPRPCRSAQAHREDSSPHLATNSTAKGPKQRPFISQSPQPSLTQHEE